MEGRAPGRMVAPSHPIPKTRRSAKRRSSKRGPGGKIQQGDIKFEGKNQELHDGCARGRRRVLERSRREPVGMYSQRGPGGLRRRPTPRSVNPKDEKGKPTSAGEGCA